MAYICSLSSWRTVGTMNLLAPNVLMENGSAKHKISASGVLIAMFEMMMEFFM